MQVSVLAEVLCFGTVFDLTSGGSVSEVYHWVVFDHAKATPSKMIPYSLQNSPKS